MSIAAPCSCPESEAWKKRALASELALRFVRGQLNRLREALDRELSRSPNEDVSTTEGVVGMTIGGADRLTVER